MPELVKPKARTGMSSKASGGISAWTTTAITAKIARINPKRQLIKPFQNIIIHLLIGWLSVSSISS